MLTRLVPWKTFLRLAARRYGFIDPVGVLAQLRSFAQPSEVQEPVELLRAGMVFHARGLLNTRAIQHNLDWVWPYWIVRQFNPADPSFIPRAFSFSHINLTHRNWTAIGLPDLALYPIVDPRGLVTPLDDGWSIDCWLQGADGVTLFPSRLEHARQRLVDDDNRRVVTECGPADRRLITSVWLDQESSGRPLVTVRAATAAPGWLVVALRPFNPEGVQFIETAEALREAAGWLVNGRVRVWFDRPAARMLFSDYQHADVASRLQEEERGRSRQCRIGMVTAAALFPVSGGQEGQEVTVRVELPPPPAAARRSRRWPEAVQPAASLHLPDARLQGLYDTAVRTLIHLAAGDIVPGPYTYKRFWFRDACLMLHPLVAIGLADLCRRQLDRFPARQKKDGFFHSQAGEWDANGQVLWLCNRYRLLTGGDLSPQWLDAIWRGGQWIEAKRVKAAGDARHHGLLPPGFSAEHFGPNDYYYWDDFWALAGLAGAAATLDSCGRAQEGRHLAAVAADLQGCLAASLDAVSRERGGPSRCRPTGAWIPAPSGRWWPTTRSSSFRPGIPAFWPRPTFSGTTAFTAAASFRI
ncbi:MAG: hypothetical protein AB1634_06450 [Thermodesulfobacteriota bacterium]